LSACAVAIVTGYNIIIGNCFFTALSRFLKRNNKLGFNIISASGSVGVTSAISAESAESAEKAVKDISDIHILSEGASASAAEIRVYAGVTVLIITRALSFV
jgi:hypothetical protein